LHLASRLKFLGIIRFDLLLIAILLVLTFFSSAGRKSYLSENDVSKYFKILILYIILTIPFVEWPGSAIKYGVPALIKGVVFYFFTVAFVTSEKKLGIFILVFILCQTFRALEPLYLHLTDGYWGSSAYMSGDFLNRLSGAPLDTVNPNGLAFIIVTVLPFCYFFYKFNRVLTLAVLGSFPLLIYALILTGSRSGMLALFIIFVGVLWKSKKRAILLILFVVSAGIVFSVMSDNLKDRYESIFDPSSKNAATVQGRIEAAKHNLEVVLRKPFFGYGLGTSAEANFNFGSKYQRAHNLYLEVAQELGVFGLIIFLLFLKAIVQNFILSYNYLKSREDVNPFLIKINDTLVVLLIMNILFSFASYGLLTYQWYFFAGISTVLRKIVGEELKAETSI
jgi:O-antigen ligase